MATFTKSSDNFSDKVQDAFNAIGLAYFSGKDISYHSYNFYVIEEKFHLVQCMGLICLNSLHYAMTDLSWYKERNAFNKLEVCKKSITFFTEGDNKKIKFTSSKGFGQ